MGGGTVIYCTLYSEKKTENHQIQYMQCIIIIIIIIIYRQVIIISIMSCIFQCVNKSVSISPVGSALCHLFVSSGKHKRKTNYFSLHVSCNVTIAGSHTAMLR